MDPAEWFSCDVWHWHGAVSEQFMTHLAIWDGIGHPDIPESTWSEHVTDEEYRRIQTASAS
jgi:hypothetical protein